MQQRKSKCNVCATCFYYDEFMWLVFEGNVQPYHVTNISQSRSYGSAVGGKNSNGASHKCPFLVFYLKLIFCVLLNTVVIIIFPKLTCICCIRGLHTHPWKASVLQILAPTLNKPDQLIKVGLRFINIYRQVCWSRVRTGDPRQTIKQDQFLQLRKHWQPQSNKFNSLGNAWTKCIS